MRRLGDGFAKAAHAERTRRTPCHGEFGAVPERNVPRTRRHRGGGGDGRLRRRGDDHEVPGRPVGDGVRALRGLAARFAPGDDSAGYIAVEAVEGDSPAYVARLSAQPFEEEVREDAVARLRPFV